MILYESTFDGVHHELGTSGFLYRSDKLMYDAATSSLWNTLQGRPVIGPLVGKRIQLRRRSVVTTTWGAWKARHPGTKVLALKTGFDRDYGEGVAYRDYFATDRLMFNVAPRDARLANKAEVLGLILDGRQDRVLAIEMEYLKQHPIHHGELRGRRFVVLTDESGAARVYEAGDARIVEWDGRGAAKDEKGRSWTLYENRLQAKDGASLARLPQHRAFWFGWYAAFPETRLLRLEPSGKGERSR